MRIAPQSTIFTCYTAVSKAALRVGWLPDSFVHPISQLGEYGFIVLVVCEKSFAQV